MFPGRKLNYSDRKQTNSDSSDQKGGTSSNVNVSSLSKKDASLIINSECCQNGPTPELDILMDYLFHPEERLDNPVSIEWVRWLIAGGRTPEEFASIVRSYDNHAKCGLVWVPHVVAYRCRTCGISPCMSICRDCFKKGDHTNHDFNMFLSQAGGACDCGDTSVMKAEGFCSDHGINNQANKGPIPANLLAVAEAIMPKLLFRLLHHFREFSNGSRNHTDTTLVVANQCEEFSNMLMDLNNMGELMRKVMTRALINPDTYKLFCAPFANNKHGQFLEASRKKYEDAVNNFPRPEPPDEYAHLPALGKNLKHSTLLEEFIFWTYKYEFPQNLVCFLLNMLPDQEYKENLTRTFVMHYSRIPCVLEISKDPDTLSNRVVHMSVQLFSNESLALKMVEELSLLHVMIISLKLMMSKILIQSTLHDKKVHFVIDCAKRVMREHCYWPLVSDFNNVLSHESVALVFLRDDNLIDMWFQFLSMLQGMNVNVRETGSHIEFEPSSYYAAFSCELEASAYAMWSIISHLKDGTHIPLAKKMLSYCLNSLNDWLMAINFDFVEPKNDVVQERQASFHFPLHRYYAAFICQAVTTMGISLYEILPSPQDLKMLMVHPLRVQSFFYEVLAGIWVRNGLQIKGQAMTYIQANFCNSMVDMDIFFLQICATQLPPGIFLQTAIDIFRIGEWFEMSAIGSAQEMEQDSMLEGFLTFLATIVSSRTNLGNDERTQCIIEISALLSTENKTHSQLQELMPERSGNGHTKNFEIFLKQLSKYKAPASGSENLEQGLFNPIDDVWDIYYDPLHILLRAVHRRDFQCSMDRFTNYVKSKNLMPKSGIVWPPYRLPRPVGKAFKDPCQLLNSKVFHSMILSILYRAHHTHNVSEQILSLAVFLLEIAVEKNEEWSMDKSLLEYSNSSKEFVRRGVPEILSCYPTNNLCENLMYVVKEVSLKSQEVQAHMTSNPMYENINNNMDDDMAYLMNQSEDQTSLVPSGVMDMAISDPPLIDLYSDAEMQLSEIPSEQSLVIRSPSQDDDDDEWSTGGATSMTAIDNRIREVVNRYPISLPESGMEVAIMRDLSLARAENPQPNHLTIQQRALPTPSNSQNSADHSEMFSPTSTPSNMLVLPFQRVQPVAVPNRSMDIVPSNSRRAFSSTSFRKRPVDNSIGGGNNGVAMIKESILSLLLKLHSQLSGTLDSFSLEDIEEDEASTMEVDCEDDPKPEPRIGDGPFFIANVLKKIAKKSPVCAQNIQDIRQKLWPNQREKQAEQKAKEAKEKEERKKKAKERQKKMMEEFFNKQKQFMDNAGKEMDTGGEEDEFIDEEVEVPREKEYDCIICNCTGPSTETNPFGLIVLVEASGVLGHRRKNTDRLLLPLSLEDAEKLDKNTRLASEFNKRTQLLTNLFGKETWYLTNNSSFESGVHVQSCGHHLHMSCYDAYLQSLLSTHRQSMHVERGEFFCPVCRQLSNSVLPLSPQVDKPTPVVRSVKNSFKTLVQELMILIKENEKPSSSTKLSEAMGKSMENMTNIAHRRNKRMQQPSFRCLFQFVTSIARTNLESEIIQRGGSLCSNNVVRYKPKRDCIVPLLHVLSVHARVLSEWPLWHSWASLAGLGVSCTDTVSATFNEILPSLMYDPIALLIKFLLIAPLHLDQVYFTCIVKVSYNLLYYQIVAQLCNSLTDSECDEIIVKYSRNTEDSDSIECSDHTPIENLGQHMAYVLLTIKERRYSLLGKPTVSSTNSVNMNSMELQLQQLCLPFLRIAALLQHHLYHIDLPEIATPQLEFVRLVYYLELVTNSVDWETFNASKALCFIPGTQKSLAKSWCRQLIAIEPPTDIVWELIKSQHCNWQQPKLLQLPKEYESLFTYYHEKSCEYCGQIPKESSICLFCGTIVCLKQQCCAEDDCFEAVRHTINCGGGIGIFLVVTSTYIIVIRGKRACLWGSLYLDDFDEEDRDLKRGKPLYLSQDRFNLLESQWLSHKFAHTKHTWVFHRDVL